MNKQSTAANASAAMHPLSLAEKKSQASAWFHKLRDTICAEFEKIEREFEARVPKDFQAVHSVSEPRSGKSQACGAEEEVRPPSGIKFTRTPWMREGGGSGEMSVMKGRVFEKVGVNISTVMGEFSEQFRKEIPGATENPRFWASGISLVAHPLNPLVPAAHMNTRMIVVGEEVARVQSSESSEKISITNHEPRTTHSRLWFGGGGDLTPTFAFPEDTAQFHAAFKRACDASDRSFYPAFKEWCREYFWLPHRHEERGVGGIFYDYLGLNTLGMPGAPAIAPNQFGKGGLGKEATAAGMALASNTVLDWNQCFAFTQAVGSAFNDVYSALVRNHCFDAYTPEQKHAQMVKRGRYAEYNLLYDRGTRFGLMTGGNPEAILMSLPPMAVWE